MQDLGWISMDFSVLDMVLAPKTDTTPRLITRRPGVTQKTSFQHSRSLETTVRSTKVNFGTDLESWDTYFFGPLNNSGRDCR